MRVFLTVAGMSLLASPALADQIEIGVTLPEMDVAEYHKPYVAAWIAKEDYSVAANLAVWYQIEKRGSDEGETWLKDLRQWWRRAGRSLEMPQDGLSGPTHAPGEHALTLDIKSGPLSDLQPGSYMLIVEAVREVGGREMVRVPFQWPLQSGQTLTSQGESELGQVRLALTNSSD